MPDFLRCIPPSTLYTAVGIIYSFIAAISFAYYVYAVTSPDSSLVGTGFSLGNLIAFGLPALFWSLDQINPHPKYKSRFVWLYVWLTLIWTFIVFAFLGIILVALFTWGGPIETGAVLRICVIIFAFWAINAVPTIYIAKALKDYFE